MGDPIKDKFYYGAADYLRKKNPNISQEEVSAKVEEFRQNPEQYYANSYKELTGKTIDKKSLETASEYDGITVDPNRLSPNQINFVDNDKLELISTKKELDKKNSEMMLPLNASDEEIGKYWDKNAGVAKSFIGSVTEKVSSIFEGLIGDIGPDGIKNIGLDNKDNKSRNNYIAEEKKKRAELAELEKSYESKLLEQDLDKVSISDFFNDAKKVTRKSTTPEIMTALLNPVLEVNDVFSGNDAREERQNAFLDSQKYLEVLNKKAEITFKNISDPVEKELAQKIVKGEKPEIAEGFKPSKNFENFIKSYDNLNQQYTESAEMFGKDELGKKKTYEDILYEHRLKRQVSADKNQNWFTKGKDEQTLPSGDKEIRYIPSRSRTWLNGLMSDYIGFAKNAMDSFSNNEIEEKIKEAKKNGNEKEYLRLQRMLSMDDLKEDLRKIDVTTQSSDATNAVYENRVFVDGFKIQVDSKGNVQRMVNSDGKTVHTLSTAQQNAIQKYQADPKKYEIESGFSDSWGKSLLNATGNTVTQMLPMIAGGIMSAPLRGVGMFGTAVANTVPTAAMFMPSYNRYFEERFRETGDWTNATTYAGFMAGAESAIEWAGGGSERRFAENVSSAITPELLRSAGQRAANTMLNARNLATSTGGESFMNSLIKELKKDVLSEEVEEFATLFIHSGINKLYGKESTVDANELLTTLLITPLATAPMSMVGNITNYKGKKTDFKNMVLAAASDVKKTEDVLVEMVSKNITTQDDAKKKMDLVKAVASRKDNYGERSAGMNLSFTEEENGKLEDYMFEEAVGEINNKKVDYTKEVDAIIAAATKRSKVEAAKEKNDHIIPIETEDDGAERMKRPLRYRRPKNEKGYVVEDTVGPDGSYSTVSNDDNIQDGEISLNFNITNDDAEILSSEIQDIAAAEGIPLKMDVAKGDNNTDVPLRVSFNSPEHAQIVHEKLKSSPYYNQMVPQKTDRILGKKIDEKVQFGVRNLKDIRKAQDIIENSTKDEDGNYLYSNEGLEMIVSPDEYAQYEEILFAADKMWQSSTPSTPVQEGPQSPPPLNELRTLVSERTPQVGPQTRTTDERGFERLNVKTDVNLQDAFDYTDGDKKEIPVFRNGKKGVLRVDEGGAMEFDNGTQIIEYGNINDQRTNTLSELGFTFPEDFKVKNGNIVIDGELYQNPYSSPDAAIVRDEDGNITSVELEKREIRGGYNGIQINDVLTPVTFTGQRAIDVATILMENELATNTKLREEFESFPAPDIQPSFVPKNVTVDQLGEILLDYFPDKPALAMETAKIYFVQAVRMSTLFPQQYPTPAAYIIEKINKDTVQNITDIERLKAFLTNIINTTDNQERIDFAQRALDNVNRINAIKVQTPQELIIEINSKPLSHISLGPGLGMGQNEANGTYLSTETKGNRYELIKTPGAKIYSAKVNISNPYDLDANMDDINSLRNRNLPVAIQRYISDNNLKGNDKKQLQSVTSFDSDILETFVGFDQYLADAVTEDLQAKGYDSLYSRQSEGIEGYLVVFNKDNVTLTEQKFVEKVIKKKKVDGRGKNTFSTISKLMDKIGGPGNNPMLNAIEALITGNISRESFLKEVSPSMDEAMKLVFSKVLTTKPNGITISQASENRGDVDEIAVKDAIIDLLNNYDYNRILSYVESIANMDEMRDPREIAFENDPEFRAAMIAEQEAEAAIEQVIYENIPEELYAELIDIENIDLSTEDIIDINAYMEQVGYDGNFENIINRVIPFDPEFEFIIEQVENKIEDAKAEQVNQGDDAGVVAREEGVSQPEINDDRQEVEDEVGIKVVDEIDRLQKLEQATNQLVIEKRKQKELQKEVTQLNKDIVKNANENQANLFGEAQPNLGLDNPAEQRRILNDRKAELDNQTILVYELERQIEGLLDLKNQAVIDFESPAQEQQVSSDPIEQEIINHADTIRNKFRQEFTSKGIPSDQVDAAIALMDIRANNWAKEEIGRKPDDWYSQIADVRSEDFVPNEPISDIVEEFQAELPPIEVIDFVDQEEMIQPKSIQQLQEENRMTQPKIPVAKVFLNDNIQPPREKVSRVDKFFNENRTSELPRETVNVSDIIPTQKNLTIDNLENTVDVQNTEESIVLLKHQGKYYVLDGHHRIANRILEGNTQIEANIYDSDISEDVELDTKKSEVARVERLEDFGEKIGGAKKDLSQKLAEITGNDIATKPLSKSFPEPNYKKLVEEGVITQEGAIFLKFFYQNIPSKPRKEYRIPQWTRQVQNGIDLFRQVIEADNTKDFDYVQKMMDSVIVSSTLKRDYRMFSETMKGLGFPDTDVKLGDFSIKQFESGFYTNESGKKVKAEEKYTIVKGYSIVKDFPTMEDAIIGLGQILFSAADKKVGTKFDIYQDTRTKKFFVGKKGTKVIRIVDGFDSAKEAREFLKEQQESVQGIWDNMKNIPDERRNANRERIGIDWRNGRNISSEKFGQTFGFRGVEFGNWVNNQERQSHVNEAFDALMDLSSALGVSPKALSLNGELGLAFGARGSGKASAHYEPGKVVINLTKKKGAGSLAHEWWHALDNYFSRNRGLKDNYLTESPRQRMNRDGTMDESIRLEIINEFKDLMKTITGSKIKERSAVLDGPRSKQYWSTDIEMSARAFENYIIEKLGQTNHRNDYLANFKETGEWISDAGENLNALENYPYPLAEESPVINEAFQSLFEAMHEDATGKLYQDDKGAVETLDDGRKVIIAMNAPDFSTMVHEIAHIFESELSSDEQRIVKDFGGSEPFARAFENYLREGNAPNQEIQSLFDKFKNWMTNIYRMLKGSPIDVDITPEIRQIFDRLLSEQTPQEIVGPIDNTAEQITQIKEKINQLREVKKIKLRRLEIDPVLSNKILQLTNRLEELDKETGIEAKTEILAEMDQIASDMINEMIIMGDIVVVDKETGKPCL